MNAMLIANNIGEAWKGNGLNKKAKISKPRGFIQRIVAKRLYWATVSCKSALISTSQPCSQAFSEHCKTTWCRLDHVIQVGVSRDMPVYSPGYARYSFSLGMLRVSMPGCLVSRRGGLPVQRRSPTWTLTGPSVEKLRRSAGTCYRYAKPAMKGKTRGKPRRWERDISHK